MSGNLKRLLSMVIPLLHVDQLMYAEVKWVDQGHAAMAKLGIANILKRNFPLSNIQVALLTSTAGCFCSAVVHNIAVTQMGYFEFPLLFPMCVESYLKLWDVMQQDTVAYFPRPGWGNHSSGWEWRKGRGDEMPTWLKKLKSSKKKANWMICKSTDVAFI